MPVIINDFEVVMEPQQGGANRSALGEGQSNEGGGAGGASLRPEDVEKIVRHFRDRYARLLAD